MPPPPQPCAGGQTTINDAIAAGRDNSWDGPSPKTARHYESVGERTSLPQSGPQDLSLGIDDVERFYRSLKAQGIPSYRPTGQSRVAPFRPIGAEVDRSPAREQ
jgi:hypothetical protein